LFRLYSRAPVAIEAVSPDDVGGREIGHVGFFRPVHSDGLWSRPLDWLTEELARAGR
jgi:predicted alpha/beta hydrolase